MTHELESAQFEVLTDSETAIIIMRLSSRIDTEGICCKFKCICLPTEHQTAVGAGFKGDRAFQVELGFRNVADFYMLHKKKRIASDKHHF